MKSLDEIRAEVERLAAVIGAKPSRLPTYGYSEDDGRPHIETTASSYAYAIRERGQEQSRFETADLDALLERVFADVTFGEAIEYELARRDDTRDARRLIFARQLELLTRLSPSWAEHREHRITAILHDHPYDDASLIRARYTKSLRDSGTAPDDAWRLACDRYPLPAPVK